MRWYRFPDWLRSAIHATELGLGLGAGEALARAAPTLRVAETVHNGATRKAVCGAKSDPVVTS
jgi:hypothetical protein